jgi:hypothetical protein
MCLVIFSAGFETVLAEDSASGREDKHSNVTKTQTDTDQASGDISDTALKATGELYTTSPHDIEWVDFESETRESEETDSKGVPDAPDTIPSNNRTRSGNLDAYYGKSK